MIDKDELLAKYSSNLPDGKYRNHYLSYAQNFLAYADSLDKETVTKYLAKLKRQGKKPGTINFAFRVIRRVFVVNKRDWPFRRGEAPPITQRDEHKPALDPELIKVMIKAAKDGKLHADEALALALSTTYGLRREEMCNLEPRDVDLKQNTIFISTIKHGRQRYHLIPPEIKPYLAEHDFNEECSLIKMSQLFWRIVNGSGLEALRGHRLGWHSIRRPLLSLLHSSGLDPFAVHSFMRWKGGMEADLAIDARYHATSFVGLDGEKPITMEAQSDKEIFEKHPFLEFWR
ncbi:hypothetical protein ES707_00187 [subsurface metagenome]